MMRSCGLLTPACAWHAQVINISSGGGSLGRAKEDLGKAEESQLLPIAMAYKASKAALNMRAFSILASLLSLQTCMSAANMHECWPLPHTCSHLMLLNALHKQNQPLLT